MKKHRILLSFLGALLVASALPHGAAAQSRLEDRVERMERDLMILQRQFYRNQGSAGTPASSGSTNIEVTGTDAASLGVRLSQIEQRMRELNGQIEKAEFSNRQLSEKLDKFATDVDYRLRALESGPASAATMGPQNPVAQDNIAVAPVAGETASAATSAMEVPRGEAQDMTQPAEAGSATEKYNQAFALLNQARYDDAALSFQEFTMNYPGDPLVGNAYYWLGETYYVRRNYLAAADNFRKGYEKAPDGPKAPDNLLKLGMSLSAMDKKEEACVVLAQVKSRFPKASSSVMQKVDAEKTRLGCK